MVIPNGVNIPMPRPHGGQIPVITSTVKQGEGETGEIITVQLGGVIGPITQFLELLDTFDRATENDEIVININTPGGDVYTTMTLVERMENCKAKVITVASGLVASAGTFLWFYGKERRVNRWARFLFHCSSHGDFGRSLQIQETATKLVKFMKEIGLQLLGAGIINHAEYVAAFENKADVELSGATIRARLAKAFKAEAGEGGDGGEGGGDGSEDGGTDGGDNGSLNDNPDEGDGATPALKKKKQKLKKRRKGEADGGAGAGEGGEGEGDAGDDNTDTGSTGGEGDQGGEGSTTLTDAFARILSENDIENPAEGDGDDTGSDDNGAGDGDDGDSDEGDDDGAGEGDDANGGAGGVEGRCGKKGKKKVKKGRRAEAGDSGEAKPDEKGDTEDDLNEDAGIDNDDVEGPKFDPEAILAENGLEVPSEGDGDGDDDEGDDDDDDEGDDDDGDDAGEGGDAGSVEARKKKSSKKRRCK